MSAKKKVHTESFHKKPAWFNLINSTWKVSYGFGTKIKLEKDHLIKLSRKQTGLHSFGKDFWEEPLERLIDSLNHEADLHPVGRFITQKRLTGLLSSRLRAEMWFKKHPEILEQDLYPVTLICGLQRTGTTKLHRLLSADPENRTLLSWEAINPAPMNDDPKEIRLRKKAARMSEKALRFMAPGFFSIHPVEHEAPEEDILLLDVTFLSTTPEAIAFVPSYASWLENTDQSYAYEYTVKLLKLLQWQHPAKKWVLKSPHHMEFLNLVKKYFGTVHYIWTHRSIYESLPSFMSMVAHSQSIFSNKVTLEKVAQHWVRKTAYILSKGVEFRKTNPNEKFTDVFYDQLISDPMKILGEIYSNGEPISPELHKQFLKTDQLNSPNRYGIHIYSLKDFNLNPENVDKKMCSYYDLLTELYNHTHDRKT
ncbi:MAG: sulfotransferase [Bacteroidales bacterium]|nr:sulfotransferase [Bacteroidales bacterium]